MPDHTPESLRAMVAAATPGPWHADLPAFGFRGIRSGEFGPAVCGMPARRPRQDADARLLAAAPELALALADALETIDAERQAREAAEARVREMEAS